MNKNFPLRLLYIRQQNGATVIRHIDCDILRTFSNADCFVKEIDLTPLLDLEESGQTKRLGDLQQQIIRDIKVFNPHYALGYNFTGIMPSGNCHVLERLNIPYIGLFYDNPLYFEESIQLCQNKELIYIFGIDKALFHPLRQRGFRNLHYFPIATSFHLKKPILQKGPLRIIQSYLLAVLNRTFV